MSVREKAVTFVKKPLVIASSLMLASGPVLADDVSYTPGQAVISKEMIDPVVNSIMSTLGVVGTAAFLLLGFGVSLMIGFRVVKSLFKTASS
ncbi:hypothetical protein OM227_22790 [Escherichia albertii]|uniref:hypothetical protein n=1 Tax=Escherichia albertii TaxID=208962 RepID=UPI0007443408|nr:hypothetical protein [Escherichia albertii]EGM8069644.1 hypothetical protein [Escherichia albertii]MCZ8631427.1 hypothetical protein [Escherichia albertii]MCZ8637577.1 hypothetical protein [Escherichia albertii]MCZ8667039.1 hypothetical protein [Escherichia albertii]MCZ8777415.1 hypothetical protein [Escherichia albertii]